jgi:inner membrane protein
LPSPIAHSAAGYAIYRILLRRRPRVLISRVKPLAGLLILTVGLSLLPDVDSILGLIFEDFGRFHNSLTHSLVVGLGVAVVVGALAVSTRRFRFVDGFLLTLVCYDLHVIMDFFTIGRGVMALWPISSERFLSPVTVFYGLHWSDGIFSTRHLVTLATEIAFALLVALMIRLWSSATGRGKLSSEDQAKAREST